MAGVDGSLVKLMDGIEITFACIQGYAGWCECAVSCRPFDHCTAVGE